MRVGFIMYCSLAGNDRGCVISLLTVSGMSLSHGFCVRMQLRFCLFGGFASHSQLLQ